MEIKVYQDILKPLLIYLMIFVQYSKTEMYLLLLKSLVELLKNGS